MKKKVPLARLSICPCGFPALNDNIKLGHNYVVFPSVMDVFTYICGKCRVRQQVVGIFVEGNPGGFMPADLFDLEQPGVEVKN